MARVDQRLTEQNSLAGGILGGGDYRNQPAPIDWPLRYSKRALVHTPFTGIV